MDILDQSIFILFYFLLFSAIKINMYYSYNINKINQKIMGVGIHLNLSTANKRNSESKERSMQGSAWSLL